jgi:hypothetical protein
MDIQESKAKLQSLYDDLKKEVDGTITSTGVFLAPSAGSYYMKAKALVDEAINLSKIDDGLAIENVLHTFDKEVSDVRDYEGKGKSAKKRQEKIECLMRKATRQLYIDLCPLITDN